MYACDSVLHASAAIRITNWYSIVNGSTMNRFITLAGTNLPANRTKIIYNAARFKPITVVVATRLWLRLIAVTSIATIAVKATIITGASGISSEKDIVKFMAYWISTFSAETAA